MKSLLILFAMVAVCHAAAPANRETVGRKQGKVVLPVNQTITPLGTQIELPGLRPQGLALSPDGRILVTSGKTSELVSVDPASGAILQRIALPNAAQNERQHQGVYGHSGQNYTVAFHCLAPRECAQAQRGNPGWPRSLARRNETLRL